MNTTKKKIKIQ